MDNDVMTLLLKQMEENKQSAVMAVTRGNVKDFAEYQSLCGRIRGIGDCQQLVRDMESRLQHQDD
jgi:hypothetical protein